MPASDADALGEYVAAIDSLVLWAKGAVTDLSFPADQGRLQIQPLVETIIGKRDAAVAAGVNTEKCSLREMQEHAHNCNSACSHYMNAFGDGNRATQYQELVNSLSFSLLTIKDLFRIVRVKEQLRNQIPVSTIQPADTSKDTKKAPRKKKLRGPRNLPVLLKLRKLIENGEAAGKLKTHIILKFAKDDESKAEALLKQLNRNKEFLDNYDG
jgi:hypothetical protein